MALQALTCSTLKRREQRSDRVHRPPAAWRSSESVGTGCSFRAGTGSTSRTECQAPEQCGRLELHIISVVWIRVHFLARR